MTTDEGIGEETAEHDDLIAAGLYDPDASDGAARLALLVYLLDEMEASIPELVQADEEGGLISFAAIRSLRADEERWTLAEITARVGVDAEVASTVWRAAGFAEPRPFERRFGPSDVAAVRALPRPLGARRARAEPAADPHDRRGDRARGRGGDRAAAFERGGTAGRAEAVRGGRRARTRRPRSSSSRASWP